MWTVPDSQLSAWSVVPSIAGWDAGPGMAGLWTHGLDGRSHGESVGVRQGFPRSHDHEHDAVLDPGQARRFAEVDRRVDEERRVTAADPNE
jgi:hypothetical protein